MSMKDGIAGADLFRSKAQVALEVTDIVNHAFKHEPRLSQVYSTSRDPSMTKMLPRRDSQSYFLVY